MIVIIRSLDGDATVVVEESTTIGELIDRIQSTYGIDVGRQQWIVQEDVEEAGGFEFYEDMDDEDGQAESAMEEDEEADEDPADKGWTFEAKKKVVEYYKATPGRTFKSVKQRFRTLSQTQFQRFTAQVAAGGTAADKWRRVDGEVMAKFQEARTDMLPVHDADLPTNRNR
jgi:hypothetical protein